MYCGRCGSFNPDTSLFCFKCGADLSRVQSQHQQMLKKPGAEKGSEVVTQPLKPFHKATTPAPTSIIGGRYQIVSELGRGGRGVVFKAFDKQLELNIAIKFLPPELASDLRAVEELKTEAKAAMMLSHPNIVRLHNFEDIDGHKFLTMEYIDGSTLDDVLSRRKQFTVNETLQYAIQILSGLDYAHKKGIIHRDLKPSNLMKTSDDIVKITDYGIASIISDSMKKVSEEFVIGTPRYMSPEQLLGKKLDNRSDLYSLGVVLYEFLSGKPPFTSGGLEYQIINTTPESLTNIPERLNFTILKALSKNPDDRWINAQQFADALLGKIKIELPSVEPVKDSLGKRLTESIKDIKDNIKEHISADKQKTRRAKLERRKKIFEKKKKMPIVQESQFFRHTIIFIWIGVFALLFPFNINITGIGEAILLMTLFLQGVIFGFLSYWRILSSIAAFILPFLAYYVSFPNQDLLVRSRGIEYVILISLLNGFIAWCITNARIHLGHNLSEMWKRRDLILIWPVIVGGLFIIPLMEKHTSLGITHISPLIYILILSLLIGKVYNSWLFPLITIVLFTISSVGFEGLFDAFINEKKELLLVKEMLPAGSYKYLIIEMTIVMGLLSFLSNIVSIILKYTNAAIRITLRAVITLILLGLSLFAYRYYLSKDIYINSKVFVESGEITLGISQEQAETLANLYGWDKDRFVPEYPDHTEFVNGFYIDRFEVTRRQYEEFLEATGKQQLESWRGIDYPFFEDFRPAVGITFAEANKYAEWRGGRLPSEAEWILAARGTSKFIFSWGDNVKPSTLSSIILSNTTNSQESDRIEAVVVGWYYTDMSPFGCFDMGGNVMEWVTDEYVPYKGNTRAALEPDFKKGYHLVKGGSYNHPIFQCRVTARYPVPEDANKLDVGLRCVYDIQPEKK